MSTHMPRVVYWNSQPTPYMVGRWNEVARRGNVEMFAWFNVVREADRSWTVDEDAWLFQGSYIEPMSAFGRRLYLPARELARDKPDLVIQEYASLSHMAGLFLTSAGAPRVAFRALPTFDAWVTRSLPKEVAKHQLFRAVDAVKTGGPDGVTMLGRYGLPADRSFAVTQSVDTALYAATREIPSAEREAMRSRLGVHGTVFVYVGRLWQAKGLDFLLHAYRTVREATPDVSLLLIGDGVDETRYREMAANDPSIVFAGFVQAAELPSYYAASDVFVFPTLGDPHGLVVEEAMAAGLPILVTSAAGDIRRRVPEGEIGFVVPPADAVALADRMLRLAHDERLRQAMAVKARTLAAHRSHQVYADEFEGFVHATLTNRARRTPQRLGFRVGGRVLTPLVAALGRTRTV